jgi:hypothetical protein
MDKLVEWFLRPGIIVLIISFVWLTYLTKKVVETKWPHLASTRTLGKDGSQTVGYAHWTAAWWNGVILEALPILWSLVLSLINNEFIFGTVKTYQTKLLVAAAIGWMSSFLYKIVKRALPKYFGVQMQDDSSPLEQAQALPASPAPEVGKAETNDDGPRAA